MIGQVSERNDHFERVLVRWSPIGEVIRTEESCEAQVFYFCDKSFPIGPGKAILAFYLYGYCYHVFTLLIYNCSCSYLLKAYGAGYVKACWLRVKILSKTRG